ncbi:TIM barrel protein [Vibrio rhizosphaerae]|uniref:TIM barrel protein n=1 Tax=Vibrio rhizosphaerae TaxID=398736 RepID=A0ABU4J1S5_9VIBR|nr:TIM barrel protein [Vibrio rhizosphaerae]MDW6094804.1 TIM barrel protein [Vibrio rhizosphaerae]
MKNSVFQSLLERDLPGSKPLSATGEIGMELELYRTLWGVSEPLNAIAPQLKQAGFDGVEGRVILDDHKRAAFKHQLAQTGLSYIAIIFTGGDVIPDQSQTPDDHLNTLETQLEYAKALNARFVNVLAGNDRWPMETQVRFFRRAVEIASQAGMTCSFETHRGSSLYSPWVTLELMARVPELVFTMDISHWFLVCERLLDRPEDDLSEFLPRVFHIQARVGYDQGAQVPHPAAPEYQATLAFHQSLWQQVWQHHLDSGRSATTMTAEFGPDGYLHHLPFTDVPVADLWSLNDWIAKEERAHFQRFAAHT